jgi:hypothetical protein
VKTSDETHQKMKSERTEISSYQLLPEATLEIPDGPVIRRGGERHKHKAGGTDAFFSLVIEHPENPAALSLASRDWWEGEFGKNFLRIHCPESSTDPVLVFWGTGRQPLTDDNVKEKTSFSGACGKVDVVSEQEGIFVVISSDGCRQVIGKFSHGILE